MYFNNQNIFAHSANLLFITVASQLLETEGLECYFGAKLKASSVGCKIEKRDCGNAKYCVNVTGGVTFLTHPRKRNNNKSLNLF